MQTFQESEINKVAEAAGVYRLYRPSQLIFIAMALDVRAALRQHRNGEHGPCTQSAASFDYQLTENPVALQRVWLSEFAAASGGKLPECNQAARKSPPR